jgi:hypothetical protein
MAEEQKRKVGGKSKESPLVAVAINEGNSTTLITPHGEYVLAQWGLVNVKAVEDYAGRVREELLRIAEQVKVGDGAYSDRDIRIQVRYGVPPIKLS